MLTPFVLMLAPASGVPVLTAPALFRALLELRYPTKPLDQVGATGKPVDTHAGTPRSGRAKRSRLGKGASSASRSALRTSRERQHPVPGARPCVAAARAERVRQSTRLLRS